MINDYRKENSKVNVHNQDTNTFLKNEGLYLGVAKNKIRNSISTLCLMKTLISRNVEFIEEQYVKAYQNI